MKTTELSERERQVLALYTQGKRVARIAEELQLSTKSVSTYLMRARVKFGAEDNAAMLRLVQTGSADPEPASRKALRVARQKVSGLRADRYRGLL